MDKGNDGAFRQQLQSILEGIRLGLTDVPSSARLKRTWIYRDRVAVIDFNVHGQAIGFDVTIEGHRGLRVEVFSRAGSTKSLMKMLDFEPLANGHLLAAEIDASAGVGELSRQASQVIVKTVGKIAESGVSASDLHMLSCVGAMSPLVVVDVGANGISEPPYAQLKDADLCKVIGFEPQRDAFDELQRNKRDNEEYFPFAIGAPGPVDINIYKYSGFTSTYKIDESTISTFPGWYSGTRLIETLQMNCVALDDVPGLPSFDMLKIDIQGGELNVFRNARRLLASALCVITEVGFFPLYEKAPNFADVHMELTGQDFILHKFLHKAHASIGNSYNKDASKTAGASQIIDGDAVYIRDYRNMETLSSVDIRKIALLSHFVFSSKDLTLRMLGELVKRNEVRADSLDEYIKHSLN